LIRALVLLLALGWPASAAAQAGGFEALAGRFTAQWAVFERPGLRVLASDPERVHELALDTLAAFVDTCLVRLDAPTRVRRELRRQPIRYYFCADATEVHFLTGTVTEGLALLEPRAVVTKWLPRAFSSGPPTATWMTRPGSGAISWPRRGCAWPRILPVPPTR